METRTGSRLYWLALFWEYRRAPVDRGHVSIPEELATQVADANNHSVSVGLGLLCKDAGGFLGCSSAGNLQVDF